MCPSAALESGDISQFAAPPRMARPNLSLRWVPTVLCPSAALESGDSFTDRSPPGMARSNLSL
eukprot:4608048-Pyramimonas_sp.AAC.1